MHILDFIDCDNLEHLKAIKYLDQNGKFPDGFLPKDIENPPREWYWRLYVNLGKKWLNYKLSERSNMQPVPSGNTEAGSSTVGATGL